jgi:hypothetical protein
MTIMPAHPMPGLAISPVSHGPEAGFLSTGRCKPMILPPANNANGRESNSAGASRFQQSLNHAAISDIRLVPSEIRVNLRHSRAVFSF